MKTVRRTSLNGNLKPSQTAYRSWGKGPKQPLRFSKSGEPAVEALWSTLFAPRKRDVSEPPQPSADA